MSGYKIYKKVYNKNMESKSGDQKNEKRELILGLVPETGVSNDYCNEINFIYSAFKEPLPNRKPIDVVKFIFKKNNSKIKKYEERFSEYKDVLNDKNKETVKKLDELASHINEMIKDLNNLNEDELIKMCNEIYFLVYGNRDIQI